MRVIPMVMLSVLMATPVFAQQDDVPAWREAVTGQIVALRSGDGETALSFAGAGFRAAYEDPQRFVDDIARSGYGPIVDSRSHSFGTFRELTTGVVVQEVEIVGTDGKVWEAIYQLADERDEGWRVQGVVLRGTESLGI
jgi:hypothetical protein